MFTDLVMPGGTSGTELAQAARQRMPGLRILFTSGYTRDAAVHGGKLGSGMKFVAKPYTLDVLAAKVREALAD